MRSVDRAESIETVDQSKTGAVGVDFEDGALTIGLVSRATSRGHTVKRAAGQNQTRLRISSADWVEESQDTVAGAVSIDFKYRSVFRAFDVCSFRASSVKR